MFKRTNGYILLTLLVLTGFAGRVTNETLKSKERHLLVTTLKESRAGLLGTVRGLSDRQLDYRPGKGQRSIREHLYHIAAAEDAFRAQAEKALRQKPSSAPSARLSDEAIAAHLAETCPATENSRVAAARWTSADAALSHFKVQRAHAIKYARTTTGDVRAYSTATPSGPADVYQIYLGLCAHQARHTREIGAIMKSPGFPKQ